MATQDESAEIAKRVPIMQESQLEKESIENQQGNRVVTRRTRPEREAEPSRTYYPSATGRWLARDPLQDRP